MALRPRLSAGLLFRTLYDYIIATEKEITPFILVISTYRIATPILFFWQAYDKEAPPTHIPVCFNTCL